MRRTTSAIALAALLLAAPAGAQDRQDKEDSKGRSTGTVAKEIATQPVRDVGIMKTKVPPLLEEARSDPYSLDGISSCAQLAAAIAELNTVLGPDFTPDPEHRRSRKIRVTGGTVAGLIVPFRGVVREVSGAASAQRDLDAAVDAGIARRGFLRGVHSARRCRNRI